MTRERVSRRRENNQDHEKGNLYLITGIVIGILIGLVISWVIVPVKFVDTVPSSLRSDFKDDLRSLIANAYHDDHNLPRAKARLLLLGDLDPIQALTNQAQALLATGDLTDKAFILANLVDALKNSSPNGTEPEASTITSDETDLQPSITLTPIISQIDNSPISTSAKSTATQNGSFFLKSNQVVCDSQKASLMLMVEVYNSSGDPLPGIELIITWPLGEEQFFTGFQPEIGLGYADYLMTPNTIYGIRLGTGDISVPNLSAPICSIKNGKTTWGGLRLIFQQP